MSEELLQIQRQQFTDQAGAERRLLGFLQTHGHADVVALQLNPKPESLNSVNGFVTLQSGERLFFKSHTEESEQLESYYNERLLADAGYPVVAPKRIETSPGEQIAFYEIISFPTLFDLVKAGEDGTRDIAEVLEAQERLDGLLLAAYYRSFEPITAEENLRAPIHQLFSHRLDERGRWSSFYRGKECEIGGEVVPFEELLSCRWRINGVDYDETLNEIATRSRAALAPRAERVSVIGHGDAHNGNLFYDPDAKALLYFDPAFAGRHHPLLDLVKPLFHNVFARWMYFPIEVDRVLEAAVKRRGDVLELEHSFEVSTIRKRILRSKVERTLRPLLRELKVRGELPPNWQQFLLSGLFCCPSLTVNLVLPRAARGSLGELYSPNVRALAWSMCIEVGSYKARGTNPIRALVSEILDTAILGA